jgi:translocator assembly and maintenance protein 41
MNELRQVLEAKFPALDFCMAYGSGVFKQKDHDASSSMIDLVFAVKDPLKWHTENLIRNPEHYSFLRYFGANAITSFQVLLISN